MKMNLYKTYFKNFVALFSTAFSIGESPSHEGNCRKQYNTKPKLHLVYPVTVLMVIIVLSFSQFTYATVTGPGAAWGFCRKITLSAATPLADFQVKVTLTTGQYTNMNATGNDLRFYDINNNVCNYWIETWNNAGTSTIWVKVFTSSVNAVYMYYGNAAAPAASNGATTFSFFDDFTSPLSATWSTVTSTGTVIQSGTNVTLSLTNTGTVSLSNAAAFAPVSTSFVVETKHQEAKYNRNRFYATNAPGGGNPLGFDNGYFFSGTGAQNSAQVFWNGAFGATVTRNTDYLSQWQITDGSAYNWKTFTYPAMGVVQSNTATYTTPDIRFISISVTEVAATSTTIDWIRVRKASSSFTEITGIAGNAVTNISASITGQTNVLCNGKSTGAATVTATGGGTPYAYSWNTAPIQTTQTATNLSAGAYLATVTENTIGISATATATITEAATVIATATGNNINCFNANDGQITITGSSGVIPYTFSVNNGVSYQGSNTFTNLSPGAYKPRVKDGNGCESKSVQ
ncbi:MAG: DUF2341 domain-containing protein [Ginsengibacter sp.]